MNQPTPRTAARPPEPELTGVRNFRDVGGLRTGDGRRVRAGRLFRSGHLAHATPADTAFLASLGLRTVIDFRNASDMALEGQDVELPGVRNVNMPLSDPRAGDGFWRMVRNGDVDTLREALGDGRAAAAMTRSYATLIRDRTAEHARLLDLLVDGEVPALVHCAAGKDRAGTSIAIVLLALGVRQEEITTDYLLSNDPHRRYRIQRGKNAEPVTNAEVNELLSPLFEARAQYLRGAFDAIEEGWGSADRYLADGLGLTGERRERLRTLLLEEDNR
ncbi:tyrosine-protein phosphatase [Streptantibioticus silvisoli]|uniref:Tyrosine-protein phosphatase n=1 Tax=Streptantibioticus silvisoli TaxID=2705255 RepID=A0ABT6W129_9ACTN|nr:tyrosine-protein phosphatase [Streptantibioticus silvisoli]MDI5963216.1 tyrosine-protein phosphatase [Streptantibioticus silvisoli]